MKINENEPVAVLMAVERFLNCNFLALHRLGRTVAEMTPWNWTVPPPMRSTIALGIVPPE
jgi:hypothetical protein